MLPSLLAIATSGVCLAGCASMTQDVDAYYRQMAYNYQEALDKAKLDTLSLENQARVLAVTGDHSKYRRTQRELGKIRRWEERCEKEQKRFEKAAEWMEAHFHLERPKITGEQVERASYSESASKAETPPAVP
jgi:hypothetical protein